MDLIDTEIKICKKEKLYWGIYVPCLQISDLKLFSIFSDMVSSNKKRKTNGTKDYNPEDRVKCPECDANVHQHSLGIEN